jgi:mRNA interferase MazF
LKRGDIYFAALDPTRGSEVQKTRPVIIVSNDVANRASSLVTVVPMTSSLSSVFPFEVAVPMRDSGLGKDGKAMAQQVRTVDKARLGSVRRGALSAPKLEALDNALRLHLAL